MSEVWVPAYGYEGAYEVSSLGRVRSLPRRVPSVHPKGYRNKAGQVLRASRNRAFYSTISITIGGKHTVCVHRLVLESFVGPCPAGMEACHNDGDRMNNRIDNLRWDTRKANHADKNKHGTAQRGEAAGSAKLKNADIIAIRRKAGDGMTKAAIAADHGISKRQVFKILSGSAWSHV